VPFAGANSFVQTQAILHDPPRPYSASVPGEIRRVLDRMLAKSPRARYPSMEAFIADVRALHESVPAATGGWGAPAPDLGRHPPLDATAGPAEPISIGGASAGR
jgi:hypothetical protein